MAADEASRGPPIPLQNTAKDFSHEQMVSVIQSVIQKVPGEKQPPWNTSTLSQGKKPPKPLHGQGDGGAFADEKNTVDDTIDPPMRDPYEKAIQYYEKHLIVNHFQHMTAKMVLHRPANTLQYMIDWCKDMQKKHEKFQTKTLYENGAIDVYHDQD